MQRLAPAIAIVLALINSEASAQTRQVFSRTSGPSCSDYSKESVGRWKCPGPADYFVAFLDEGNQVEIAFGRTNRPFERSRSGAIWRGSGKSFGDVIEWRVNGAGLPVAAVLRTWEVGDGDRTIQSLKVFAINAGSACQHAIVPASAPRANEKAASEAVDAARRRCADTALRIHDDQR